MPVMSRLSLSLLVVCWAASPAFAQLAIPGAGEDKFGLLLGGQSITVSTSDAKLGFNWTNDPHLNADNDCRRFQRGTEAYRQCVLKSVDVSQTFVDLNAAVTGEKGKRALFSEGDITPGFEFGITVTRRFESTAANHGGYTDVYGGFIAKTQPISVATIAAAQASTLEDESTSEAGFTTGVNFFPRENFGIGLGASVKRASNTPGTDKPSNLCQITASGTNEAGNTIQVAKCDDGFVGPLPDQWVESVRVDVMKNFTRTKTDPKTKEVTAVATLGLIGSINVTHRTDTDPIFNVAFGPTLHPKGVPHKVLLAVLLAFSDITDARDKGKTLQDKFGVKLYFGIPLTAF
jgi:hypothetical protein